MGFYCKGNSQEKGDLGCTDAIPVRELAVVSQSTSGISKFNSHVKEKQWTEIPIIFSNNSYIELLVSQGVTVLKKPSLLPSFYQSP